MPAIPAGAPAPAAAAAQDPLSRFVGTAALGQEGLVTFADGRTAPVRVVRAYAAASGRDCREVLVGSGVGGRANLLCESDGQWVSTRPLLAGGGTGRP